MIEQRIKALIDKRTIQAAKNDLVKKFQVIIKAFGKPIIEQNISYSLLPDFWELESPEILDATDDNIHLRGYYFDGLSRGVNLCIKMLIYDEKLSEIRATFNGYQIFLEIEGELKCYVPFPSWENAVDRLYEYAKPVSEEKIKQEKAELKEQSNKKAISIMEKLRLLWGF